MRIKTSYLKKSKSIQQCKHNSLDMYEVWYSNAVNTDGGISPYSDETKS
jgi:hypothetical protein